MASRIPEARVAESVRHRIKEYFDYRWNTQQGIDDAFVEKLPRTLRTDVLLSRFQHALRRSLLFLADEAFHPAAPPHAAPPVDYTVAAAVFNVLRLRTFMKNDFVVQAGSHGSSTLLVLEGHAAVFGVGGRLIGFLLPGAHFDTQSPDNPFRRRLVTVVACSMLTVGVLPRKDRLELLAVYAFWRPRVELIERMLYYLKARAVIEQAAQQEGRDPASLRDLRALLEQSYAFAPEEQRRAMPEELREVAGARGSRAARGGHPSPSPSTSMRTCGSSCWRRTRRQRRRRPRPRWKRARRGCGCGCGS